MKQDGQDAIPFPCQGIHRHPSEVSTAVNECIDELSGDYPSMHLNAITDQARSYSCTSRHPDLPAAGHTPSVNRSCLSCGLEAHHHRGLLNSFSVWWRCGHVLHRIGITS